MRDCYSAHTLFRERREETLTLTKSALREGLAAELELFEPLNGFALVGNDLRLPHQRDRHAAHGDDSKEQHDADAGFLCGKVEQALKPSHGKGSPSTQFDFCVRNRANPSRQRRGKRLPSNFRAIEGPRFRKHSDSLIPRKIDGLCKSSIENPLRAAAETWCKSTRFCATVFPSV